MGFFSRLLGSQTQQLVETYTKPEQSESIPQGREIQNGDTKNHQELPPTRGVGDLNRLLECLHSHTNTGTVQEISAVSYPVSVIPIQGTNIPTVHSSQKDPPVPRGLVGEIQIPPSLSPAYSRTIKNMSATRLAGEFGEIRVGLQVSLQVCRLPVRPQRWPGPVNTGLVQKILQQKILELFSRPASPVRQFISLIGLLTATKKQVHLSRLHMRPIQWHLQSNWRVPESPEKVIPMPRSLHPHLRWC